MLNKLSFNLMNELNEADTKACEIKKQVFMESDKVTVKNKLTESWNEEILNAVNTDGVYQDNFKLAGFADAIISMFENGEVYGEGDEGNLPENYQPIVDAIANSGAEYIEVEFGDGSSASEYLVQVYATDANGNRGELIYNKLNEAAPNFNNSTKEERLASLKMQLEKDKDQLAADEIEAIEKEIADLEAELFEKEKLNETGEWDDDDEEMTAWKEDLRGKAEALAKEVNGECKVVKGFDKYQGPFAVVATPKHGDVIVWFDGEDSTGLSLIAKVAHVGWIEGGVIQLAELLNLDEIPEDQVLTESEKLDNQILNEEVPEGTAALEKLKHGDIVYVRNSDGLPLLMQYANSYPEPEDYDEGYTTGWERGADEEFDKVQDEKFVAAKEASENREVWEILEVDEATIEPNGTIYGYLYGEEELIDFLNQVRIVNVRKTLEESYSEKLGGDPADFVTDVETIKAKLSEIDTLGFGSHLAVQMVEDWIETCNYQIEKGKRLASGNEFYTEADNRTYKDRDESEYYRNKELYANSCLERHYDAMMAAKKACEEKGIKLDEKYIEFPTELEKDQYIKDNNLIKGKDYLDKGINAIELLNESIIDDLKIKHYAKKAARTAINGMNKDPKATQEKHHKEFKKAQDIVDKAREKEYAKADKLRDKAKKLNDKADKAETKGMSKGAIMTNAYDKEFNESEEVKPIAEAKVKGLKTVKSQGNIFMLEDETKKIIVGENYNESEGLIENAEIYESKEEADKDYLGRCDIKKDGEKFEESTTPKNSCTKFKIGDRVRFIHAAGRLSDEIATITGYDDEGYYAYTWDDGEKSSGANDTNLVGVGSEEEMDYIDSEGE